MADTMRFVVGILGNATSILLFAAPILTCKRIIKNKSIEDFSCVPYIFSQLSCLIYTWYGSPFVSKGWENMPVFTVSVIGALLESSYILICLWFAPSNRKKEIARMQLPTLTAFSVIALVSMLRLHDHPQRKLLVGSAALVACVAMYGSPLLAVRKVIKTKSVEFMPFYLSLFSFLASLLWGTYGLLGHDPFVASPNLVACPLGILQLVVYCIYSKNRVAEKPENMDLEKNVFSNEEKLTNQLASMNSTVISIEK
ncbi:hypothetical protein Sjap_005284 [Stephania japonica]|uniref:Bidirectional sugar transporter SWEET n=1 Tax=Stephania japonica TaxID=461633 RepID=A0AAP0K3N5_9MAGN